MAEGTEAVVSPYTAFRFEVELTLDSSVAGVSGTVCKGAFSDCDGLEMTMESKPVREGGNNQEHIHLMGPISYGQLTLKRGMTDTLDLWKWFSAAGRTGRKSTAQGKVIIWDASGVPSLTFTLKDCLPVKLRGPSLSAKDGQLAIEEMQLVYARLALKTSDEEGSGLDADISFSGGIGIGLNASANVSGSAGLNASVSGGAGLSGSASVDASASASLNIG